MRTIILGLVVCFFFALMGCAKKTLIPDISRNTQAQTPSYQPPQKPRPWGDQMPGDDPSHFVDLEISNSTNEPLKFGIYDIDVGNFVRVKGWQKVRDFFNTLITRGCSGYENYNDHPGGIYIKAGITSCTY